MERGCLLLRPSVNQSCCGRPVSGVLWALRGRLYSNGRTRRTSRGYLIRTSSQIGKLGDISLLATGSRARAHRQWLIFSPPAKIRRCGRQARQLLCLTESGIPSMRTTGVPSSGERQNIPCRRRVMRRAPGGRPSGCSGWNVGVTSAPILWRHRRKVSFCAYRRVISWRVEAHGCLHHVLEVGAEGNDQNTPEKKNPRRYEDFRQTPTALLCSNPEFGCPLPLPLFATLTIGFLLLQTRHFVRRLGPLSPAAGPTTSCSSY